MFSGGRLHGQADAEAIHYTHFDCWTDSGDSEESDLSDEIWAWDDQKSIDLTRALFESWTSELKLEGLMPEGDFKIWYLEVGQSGAFKQAAQIIAEHGYAVYDSDSMFDVYDVKDLSPADFEKEDDVVASSPVMKG